MCARALGAGALALLRALSQQLINDGSLEKFSVLQLNEYIVNSVQQKSARALRSRERARARTILNGRAD